MSRLRILCFLLTIAAVPIYAAQASAAEPRDAGPASRLAPAFAPLPIPELMATAASPDRESAARALTSLLARPRDTDHALLRLLEVGTTQDTRIALHFRDRPMEAAIPALLAALGRHDDGTVTADALAQALRACVPVEYGPPPPFLGLDGPEEDPRSWRDWARRHRRSETAACLGRSSLSVLPLLVMVATTRRRKG